eukprot:88041_1
MASRCLEKWLKVNQLLEETSEHILHDCMKDIIAHYGLKSLLKTIAKSKRKNINKLNSIYEIIRQQKVKHQNISRSTSPNNRLKNNQELQTKRSPFCKIPDENISHICDYLSRNNICKHFKRTCRQIAIVCLQEMRKITVSTFHIKKLMTNNIRLYNWDIKKTSQDIRHNPNKKYFSLFEEWAITYNIPENNLMIFEIICGLGTLNSILIHPKHIRLTKVQKYKRYLICDNRDIVIMNKNTKGNERLFDANIDKYDQIKHYKLLILEYFDIFKQNVNVIQFGLYEPGAIYEDDLLYYIQNKIINGNKLHQDLKNAVEKMHQYNSDVPQLKLFDAYTKPRKTTGGRAPKPAGTRSVLECNMHTFQLNYRHPWVQTAKPFEKSKLICEQKLDEFCFMSRNFCSSFKDISVTILNNKNELKSLIRQFYETELNHEERKAFAYDLNCLRDIINKPQIIINMSTSSKSGKLRIKLSKLLGNIIHPHNIELYRKGYLCTWLKRIPWHSPLGFTESFKCKFIIDDVTSYVKHGSNITYKIRIFKPKICPHPFYVDDNFCKKTNQNMIPKTIKIRYKEQFKFDELISHVFETIYKSKSKNNIFRADYEDELELFYGVGFNLFNNYDENNIPCRNNEIKCIISTKSDTNMKTKDFSMHDTYDKNILQELSNRCLSNIEKRSFDLFMMRVKPYEIAKDYTFKLRIKFISEETNNPKLTENTSIDIFNTFKFDGIPLDIWIYEQDTIEDIIHEYFQQTKGYIKCCYRVNVGNKLELISDIVHDEYRPYYEFMIQYGNDYLLFVFEESPYSIYIHRPTPLLYDRYYFIVKNSLLTYQDKFVLIETVDKNLNTCSIIYLYGNQNERNIKNIPLSKIKHTFAPMTSPDPGVKTIQVVYGRMCGKIGTYIRHIGNFRQEILVEIEKQNVACQMDHIVVLIKSDHDFFPIPS